MYNAGWNTNSLLSKKLSFVHNGSAHRKAARKSTFENIHFGEKKDTNVQIIQHLQNITDFFFKVQNPQGTPAGGLRAPAVPSPYFSQLWGRQDYEKLVDEVNTIPEPVVENQGGGLELSAISTRSCTLGSAQRKAPCTLPTCPHLGPCWPLLSLCTCLGSGHSGTPPLPCPHTVPSHLPSWALLGMLLGVLAGHIWPPKRNIF